METLEVEKLPAVELSKNELFAAAAKDHFFRYIPGRQKFGALVLNSMEAEELIRVSSIRLAAGLWRHGFSYKKFEDGSEKLYSPYQSPSNPGFSSNPARVYEKLLATGQDVLENKQYSEEFADWVATIDSGENAYGYKVVSESDIPR